DHQQGVRPGGAADLVRVIARRRDDAIAAAGEGRLCALDDQLAKTATVAELAQPVRVETGQYRHDEDLQMGTGLALRPPAANLAVAVDGDKVDTAFRSSRHPLLDCLPDVEHLRVEKNLLAF